MSARGVNSMDSLNVGESACDTDATNAETWIFSQEQSVIRSTKTEPTVTEPKTAQESSVNALEDSTDGPRADSPTQGSKAIQLGESRMGLEQNSLCTLDVGDTNFMESLSWKTNGTNTPRSSMLINLESDHYLTYEGETRKQESPSIIMEPTKTATQVPECTESLEQGSGPTGDSVLLPYNEEQKTNSCRAENMSAEGTESLEFSTNRTDVTSGDLSPPGVGYQESLDLDTAGISLVPVESLQLALVSNNNLLLSADGMGSVSLNSLQFGMAGADWDIGPVHLKCLELSAVNVASLTLGTVGISVMPIVSAATTGSIPMKTGLMPLEPLQRDSLSTDSISTGTAAVDSVLVDSITPGGVRDCWHPLDERLCALRDALAALDQKLESFAPRLQEADTLLNDVESSLRKHASRICDIINENSALAERILQLEEQVRVQGTHAMVEETNKEQS